MYQRKSRASADYEACPEHSRNVGLKPTNGCLNCMRIYSRAQFKRRQTASVKGGIGAPRGGRGECSVCKGKNVRLCEEKVLSSGGEMCETCWGVWNDADAFASARHLIHRDMKEVGIFVTVGGGE